MESCGESWRRTFLPRKLTLPLPRPPPWPLRFTHHFRQSIFPESLFWMMKGLLDPIPSCVGWGRGGFLIPTSGSQTLRVLVPSLLVQWWGCQASTARLQGLIPGQGTKILQITSCGKKKKKHQVKGSVSQDHPPLQTRVASPDCYLCFWPMGYKLKVPVINLPVQLTDFKEAFSSMDHWSVITGYISGTALPVHQPGSSLNPVLLGFYYIGIMWLSKSLAIWWLF